jgi:hypothetical protein
MFRSLALSLPLAGLAPKSFLSVGSFYSYNSSLHSVFLNCVRATDKRHPCSAGTALAAATILDYAQIAEDTIRSRCRASTRTHSEAVAVCNLGDGAGI